MYQNIDIQKIIPHRYPFLLVDRITQLEEGKSAEGIKNVTINEPFFQGHFPDYPVMPGVLIIEALAQVGACTILSLPENRGKLAMFTGINNFKFRRQVIPGDILRLSVKLLSFKRSMGKAEAAAYVGDALAAGGEITFALVEPSPH